MGRRWYSLVVVASLAACQFDPGGTSLDSDDTVAVDAATSAGGDAGGTVDAERSEPVDAADTPAPVTCGGAICQPGTICCVDFVGGSPTCAPADDCEGSALTCDQPVDCPGEECCMYGGFGSTCSPTCIGGDQVCDTASDCGPLAGQCCPSNVGPKVCRAVCF